MGVPQELAESSNLHLAAKSLPKPFHILR